MTMEQVEDALTAAYQAEVEYRKRQCVMDVNTKSNIKRLASFLTGNSSKFGVMFSGMCGNGKTTLVFALQNLLNYLNQSIKYILSGSFRTLYPMELLVIMKASIAFHLNMIEYMKKKALTRPHIHMKIKMSEFI